MVASSEARDRAAGERGLIERASQGDSRAFETLVASHRAMIESLAVSICGDRNDAADAVQNALVAMWKGLPGFGHRSKLSTWLYRVTYQESMRVVRAAGRRPEPVEAGRLTSWSPAADPATLVADREQIMDAIRRLHTDFRVAVALADVLELPLAEIADITGQPLGTVKSRVNRGRRQLRRQIGMTGGRG